MSSKNTAEVILGGKVIKLGGYESEEYLQRVASYINNKITEFNKEESYRRMSAELRTDMILILQMITSRLRRWQTVFH